MNKSKFLKKSLAMLLAVMLVVAMVPLSASAAESRLPDLTALTVDGTVVALESDGKTFKASVAATSKTVEVSAVVGLAATLEAINKDMESIDIPGTLTLAEFNAANGVTTVPLKLTSEDGSKSKDFSLQITKTTLKTTTNLKSAVPVADTGIISATINNTAKIIDVTVPMGYAAADSKGDLILTTADNATFNTGLTGTLEDVADKDTFTVVSESLGNVANWTVRVKEVAVLTAFKTGTVSAKINNGTAEDMYEDGEITMEFPNDILFDEDGEDATAIKMLTSYTLAYAGATVQIGQTVLTSGKEYDYIDAINAPDLTMTVTYMGVPMTYALKMTTAAQSDKDIVALTIDGETGTVSGNKITVAVSKSYDLTTKTLPIVFATSTTVKDVKMTVAGADVALTSEVDAEAELKMWSANAVNFGKGAMLTVTAADGTIKQYSVSVAATLEVDEAVVKAVVVKDNVDGKVYEAKITGTTATVTVPYMTKNMLPWELYVTPNAGAKASNSAGTAIVNGKTMDANGVTAGLGAITNGDTITLPKAFVATAKGDPTIKTSYDLVVKFTPYQSGKTLTGLSVTSSTSDDLKKKFTAITADNTYKAVMSTKNSVNYATITVPFSVDDAGTDLTATSFTTANGGVALLVDASNKLKANLSILHKSYLNTYIDGSVLADGDKIAVIPEKYAKPYTVGDTVDVAKGTVYVVTQVAKAAETGSSLKTFKVSDTTLSVGTNLISGKLPYSMTVADAADFTDDNTYFVDYTMSKYASLKSIVDGWKFNPGGDVDGDGEEDAVAKTNAKLGFVRSADNEVLVYMFDGTVANNVAISNSDDPKALVGLAEDKVGMTLYSFVKDDDSAAITYAAPNTDAAITAFKVANVTGTISGKTISIVAPYGTNLAALAPTFTVSSGAKVLFGAATIVSGETVLNFTNDVALKVQSEDGNKTVTYTVKTTVASQFSDVPTTAWYYNQVMTAAANGWVKGMGDGSFNPNGSMKRGDFAIMMANVMQADLTQYPESAFPDVLATDYYSSAIAFCADKGFIGGDDKGNFNPKETITREQMAKILCEAKGLTPVTNPTNKYADDAKIANWAKGYVYACTDAGIFEGDENDNFNPKNQAKRSEAAVVLVRAFA